MPSEPVGLGAGGDHALHERVADPGVEAVGGVRRAGQVGLVGDRQRDHRAPRRERAHGGADVLQPARDVAGVAVGRVVADLQLACGSPRGRSRPRARRSGRGRRRRRPRTCRLSRTISSLARRPQRGAARRAPSPGPRAPARPARRPRCPPRAGRSPAAAAAAAPRRRAARRSGSPAPRPARRSRARRRWRADRDRRTRRRLRGSDAATASRSRRRSRTSDATTPVPRISAMPGSEYSGPILPNSSPAVILKPIAISSTPSAVLR